MNAARVLGLAGLWGALLTVVILAMSVLLRLGTSLETGTAVSTLAPGLEQGARIAHRVAAMAVGVLAAVALVAALRVGEGARGRVPTLVAVVALTLALAMIGRHTPGYRFDIVTVINVVGGMALAAAFWRLRLPAATPARPGDPLAWLALAMLFVLAGLGAAADAAAMRGERAFGPLHLWLAAIFLGLTLAAALRGRSRAALSAAVALAATGLFVSGFFLAGTERPIALAWLHSLATVGLALLLVSLAAGRRMRALFLRDGVPGTLQPGLPSARGRQ